MLPRAFLLVVIVVEAVGVGIEPSDRTTEVGGSLEARRRTGRSWRADWKNGKEWRWEGKYWAWRECSCTVYFGRVECLEH